MRWGITMLAIVLTLSACGSNATEPDTTVPDQTEDAPTSTSTPSPDMVTEDTEGPVEPDPDEQTFPSVVAATATPSADGSWSFAVTISSPYDSPARYADAWRVLDPNGAELGVRVLTHHHATEQPFTRSLGGVVIPEDVELVVIEARDLSNGWGGQTVELRLERP